MAGQRRAGLGERVLQGGCLVLSGTGVIFGREVVLSELSRLEGVGSLGFRNGEIPAFELLFGQRVLRLVVIRPGDVLAHPAVGRSFNPPHYCNE